MKKILNRLFNMKMEKGWIWLLYLDVFLPLCLLIISFAAGSMGKGRTFSILFHSYNLYIINPVPNFTSFTGIPGLAIHIAAIAYALRKKDFKDVLLCAIISALAFLYIYFEINYRLVYLLDF